MTLYFFSRLAAALDRRLAEAARAPAREMDPIDHPAIAAMSLAELADLPLGPDRSVPPAVSMSCGVDRSKALATPLAPFSPRRRLRRGG